MRSPTSRLAVSFAALFAGSLAACGGQGAAPTPSAEPPSAAAPPSAAPEVKSAYFAASFVATPAKAGASSEATVTVLPGAGYKVNQEYPYKFKLDPPPEGVTYPTPIVTDVSRTKAEATMKVPFVAAKPGTYKVSGTCSLSVCTEENCVIEKVALAVDVVAE